MRNALLASIASLVLAIPAAAQHQDIQVQSFDDNGMQRLRTGTGDFFNPGQPPQYEIRLFTQAMGDGGDPGETINPGFNAFDNDLPAGALLSFNVLDALRVWNPSNEDFEDIASTRMFIKLFTSSVATPTVADEVVGGFPFEQVSGDGSAHAHVLFELENPFEQGIFLLQWEIAINAAGVEPSLPVFILFVSGTVDQAEIDAAEAFMQAQIDAENACPGDANGDGETTTADITFIVSNLGAGAPGASGTPGDVNGDGETTTADITFAVSNLGTLCG
ncbi:MAG: dockerin type I domain-containing protein [Planctomycetota bacterium]